MAALGNENNQISTKLQRQFNGERMVFSINGPRKAGQPFAKNKKIKKRTLIDNLTPYTKSNSKWVIDLKGKLTL